MRLSRIRFSRFSSLLPLALYAALVTSSAVGCKKGGGDFEGRITMAVSGATGAAGATTMRFEAARGSARVDLPQAPGASRSATSYALVRPDGMAVFVLEGQKAWSDLSMNKARTAMAESDPTGAPTVNKTGKHETIAGQDCEVWEVRHTSGKRTESCIAENFVGFDFASLVPGAGPFGGSSSADLKKQRLFPLRSVELDATGKETARMTVTSIERTPIDKARFEVPAGYTYVPASAK